VAELFCDFDGEEKRRIAASVKAGTGREYIKIVIGRLLHDGYRCDKCNKPLFKDDVAFYFANLDESYPDPKGEKNYFNLNKAKTFNQKAL